MSLLRRRPDAGIEEFQRQWFNEHAYLVKRIPGVLGYRQNLVIDRQLNRLRSGPDSDDLAVDGVVELWFASPEAIVAGFESARGKTTMMHAKEFIGEITTFMVDPVPILVRN